MNSRLGTGFTFSRAWRRAWQELVWRYGRYWKALFPGAKEQFNYLPENNVILVRDVVIPYLFVYKMTVDSFPSRVGQRFGGANHT